MSTQLDGDPDFNAALSDAANAQLATPPDLQELLDAMRSIPTAERRAIVRHAQMLATMPQTQRWAILTLTRGR